MDLLTKKKVKKELQSKLDSVLEKYSELENPYFVNYVHIADQNESGNLENQDYSRLALFHEVLVRKGFSELKELPQLAQKLVRTTEFRFLYKDFAKRTNQHISADLESTLRSWIEERGPIYRTHLPLMLFFLWEQKTLLEEFKTDEKEFPLISNEEMQSNMRLCEVLYFDILVRQFRTTLERFDPALFVTIYGIDAMSGYEFEDFLVKLYRVIGFDVQLTKRSADQGADLFVEKFGKKTVIQAKNYSDNVGNAAVQQALAAKAFYSCDRAMVVTNSYFTPAARALAEAAGVDLVDRKGLSGYLDQYNRSILEAAVEGEKD